MKQNKSSLFQLVGWAGLVEYALLALLSPMASALVALSLQPIVDTGLSGNLNAFGQACLAAVLLSAFDLLLYHRMQCRRAALIHRCTRRLRLRYFQQIFQQKPQHFFAQDSSDYLSKLTDDAPLISSDFLGSALDIYRCMWSLVASLAVLATAGWEPVVLVLVCSLISVYLPKCLQDQSTQAQQAYLEANRTHLALSRESLHNFLPIRLYHLLAHQIQAYAPCVQAVEERDNARQRVRRTLDTLATAISQFSFLAILAGATFLVIQGKLSVGYTMSVTQLLGGVMAPFELLPGHWMALRTGKALHQKNLTQLEQGIDTPGRQILSRSPQRISLHQVAFAYPGQPPVLHHLTLELDCHKKYALVGASGCGKSTLAKLLPGFLSPTQGDITVDGMALANIAPCALYRAIGYQGQTVSFFCDTLEHNILLGRSLSPDAWDALLHQTQLQDLVEHLPQKAQTLVEENGKNLSGGQAQRVALARCLVNRPSFLVLDEINSALDPHTSAALEETILALEGVGVLAIHHRITSERMRRYDSILVLKNGSISEQGTWEELMAKQGDFYRLACPPTPSAAM